MSTAKPTLSLYNTLTRSKAPFEPMDAGNVRLYACGPTVYDFAHIGNGRAAIVFDLLFRVLRHVYGADRVTYVRNITDVDDKINARALRDFPDLPLNEAIRRVTESTAAQYQKDVAALGCLEPTEQPRATDNIDGMQTMIARLIKRGHAYKIENEVLFAVDSMPDYGKLSGRNLDDNLAGARIAVDTHKRNPADFVLWKLSSGDEPGWDSPWGRGRPGWHIECSAMAERYLGETFDIHGGGLDLIFPHHENEIAQSRCAHGSHAMANVWMHNGFLQVEGQKMSKSLGNFYSIHQLLETEDFGGRKWPGEVLRLAMLMTHYREPIDFTVTRLLEAERLRLDWLRKCGLPEEGLVEPGIIEALTDDLNFNNARVILSRLAKDRDPNLAATLSFLGLANDQDFADIRKRRSEIETVVETALDASKYVSEDMTGQEIAKAIEGISPTELNATIESRLLALNAKDFAAADAIRTELLAQGIALMDFKDEAGQRQTKWEVKR